MVGKSSGERRVFACDVLDCFTERPHRLVACSLLLLQCPRSRRSIFLPGSPPGLEALDRACRWWHERTPLRRTWVCRLSRWRSHDNRCRGGRASPREHDRVSLLQLRHRRMDGRGWRPFDRAPSTSMTGTTRPGNGARGALGFRLAGERREARPGSAVLARRGTPHTYWNAGASEARYLLVMTPRIACSHRRNPSAGCRHWRCLCGARVALSSPTLSRRRPRRLDEFGDDPAMLANHPVAGEAQPLVGRERAVEEEAGRHGGGVLGISLDSSAAVARRSGRAPRRAPRRRRPDAVGPFRRSSRRTVIPATLVLTLRVGRAALDPRQLRGRAELAPAEAVVAIEDERRMCGAGKHTGELPVAVQRGRRPFADALGMEAHAPAAAEDAVVALHQRGERRPGRLAESLDRVRRLDDEASLARSADAGQREGMPTGSAHERGNKKKKNFF